MPEALETNGEIPESVESGASTVSAPGVIPAPIGTPAQRAREDRVAGLLARRVATLAALDAALYLKVNTLPRADWLNTAMRWLSLSMTHTEAWIALMVATIVMKPEIGWPMTVQTLPPILLATGTVNLLLKPLFRRQRPFMGVVNAVVIGRRPSDKSFPSGHAAGAFAGAVLLTPFMPALAPLIWLFALLVALSRVYLGVHFPLDVAVGAITGVALAVVYQVLAVALLNSAGWV